MRKRLETIRELAAVGRKIGEQIAALESDNGSAMELASTRAGIDAKIVEVLAQAEDDNALLLADIGKRLDALRAEVLRVTTAVAEMAATVSMVSKMTPVINVTVPEREVRVEVAAAQVPAPQVIVEHHDVGPTRVVRRVTRTDNLGGPIESVEDHEYEDRPN